MYMKLGIVCALLMLCPIGLSPVTIYEPVVIEETEPVVEATETHFEGPYSVDIQHKVIDNGLLATPDVEPEEVVIEEEIDEEEDILAAPVVTIPDVRSKYEKEIIYLAKTVYGEARGCSVTEQAAVVWCILNRVDHPTKWSDDIIGVITQKYQFTGYSSKHPVKEEFVDLSVDVLERWEREKVGDTNVGRVLPSEYLYFHGSGGHNHFRNSYKGGTRWDWSLASPY